MPPASAALFALPVHADPLALIMIALTLFVAAIIAAFARRYLRADRNRRRFAGDFALLVASVVLFVSSGNLVLLALGWIASGALLARLIGHQHDWTEARAAARRARWAFAIGDAALVAALAILGAATGSADLGRVIDAAGSLSAPVATLAGALLLVAAAARCALPPFSGWLLASMTAPTPVSALMHAGLVNAGGFLLIRFAPVLHAAPGVRLAAVAIGLIAAMHGAGVMLVRPDVKRTLAGSTVAQMGFMIMTCGLGAYGAALWHLVAHGLFKAWLFLGSGSAIGMTGNKARTAAPNGTSVAPVIAAITLALALAGMMRGMRIEVPLVLGAATALAALGSALQAPLLPRGRLATGALVAALAGMHLAGLTLMGRVLGPDGPAVLPGPALIALVAAFLGLWVWQMRRPVLPAALYVHLLNAGTLVPAHAGDA
jgi:NADH:ubiquinone oxidoreductase subunit 5 (subunit L)/multisubunit Na+/H+ antiporter MnhA subunit